MVKLYNAQIKQRGLKMPNNELLNTIYNPIEVS